MSSIFHRLHRLRKLEERTAQVGLAQARASQEACEAEVISLQDAMRRSYESAEDAATWMTHHRFALDGELSRRHAEYELVHARVRVDEAHAHAVERATDARTVELLAEAHDERTSHEARLAEQRMFDEVASMQWLRRAS